MTNSEKQARRAFVDSLERGVGGKPWYTVRGAAVKRSFDGDKKTGEFTITTEEVDRYKDVVRSAGIDTANFRRNPVVPWSHDYQSPPIARSLEETKQDGSMTATAKFMTVSEVGPLGEFAEFVFNQYTHGYLNAVSIGFIPHEWTKIKEKAEKEDDEDVWTGGFDITESELLEWSPVVVPGNAGALANSAKGILRIAAEIGMQETADGSYLHKVVSAVKLVHEYPELTRPDGLREMVRGFVEGMESEPDEVEDLVLRGIKRAEALDLIEQMASELQ